VLLKNESISSICNQSLPKACQVAKLKSRSKMTSLWGEGNNPLKTGIAHWEWEFPAYENEGHNNLPEVGLCNLWLPSASSPMRSCGTFGSFPVQTFQLFNTCNTCYIVILCQ